MKLIDRDKCVIPRQRERLIGGVIFVPLADVEAALDEAPPVFDVRDLATIAEALQRQVRLSPRWEEFERAGELGCLRTDVRPFCPTCRAELRPSQPHCADCGQAIEWGVKAW